MYAGLNDIERMMAMKFQQRLDSANQQTEQVRAQLSAEQNQKNQLLNQKNAELEVVRAQVKQLTQVIAEKESQLELGKQRENDLESTKHEIEQRLSELELKQGAQQQELDELKASLQSEQLRFEENLKEKDDIIKTLEQQLTSLKQNYESAVQNLQATERVNNGLLIKLAELEGKYNEESKSLSEKEQIPHEHETHKVTGLPSYTPTPVSGRPLFFSKESTNRFDFDGKIDGAENDVERSEVHASQKNCCVVS